MRIRDIDVSGIDRMVGSIEIIDGDEMARSEHRADMAVICFSKEEVDRGVIGDALDRLMNFSESKENTLHYGGRMLLEFAGWDQDEREIYEIPECRAFFMALTAEWPFWFHFLMKNEFFFHVLFMLTTVDKVRKQDGKISTQFFSMIEVDDRCQELDLGMRLLYKEHKLSEEAYAATLADVSICLQGIYP